MDTYLEITPDRGRFRLGLRELWQYRDLVVLFTKKTFLLDYKQTVLGPMWLLITPLLSSGVYSIVFGTVAGIRTDGIPQLLFFLCNSSLWGLFSSSLGSNSSVFRANAWLFGKVYFPRLTVPVSNTLVRVIKFGFQFFLMLCFIVYYVLRGMRHPHWWAWLLLPVLLLYVSLFGMSIGILASSMTTKYRDLSALVSFGVSLWMYVTPVVYPLSQLGEGLFRTVVVLNPMTAAMELFRWAMLGSGTVLPVSVVSGLVLFVVCALGGVFVFHRVERTFMDSV